MKYLLDTNILLAYIRESTLSNLIDERFQLFDSQHLTAISIVTVGELHSIALRNNWGKARIQRLDAQLNKMLIVDINVATIIERYAEIDAFSQAKHPTMKSNFSSRNMGKNDLWIAATTAVVEATLLTTDGDFDHLKSAFLKLEKIEITD
jgi:predicted nucleic acid-binding protein